MWSSKYQLLFFLIYEVYLGCVIQILINGYDMHKEAHLQSRKD
jgi:hypothetical protein